MTACKSKGFFFRTCSAEGTGVSTHQESKNLLLEESVVIQSLGFV